MSPQVEFIIEAGAQGRGDGTWQSFFKIERHDSAPKTSRRMFLERRFDSPEAAIRAALAEARKMIDQDPSLMARRSKEERKPA